MSEPIVFISHFRIKEGGLSGLRELFGDVSRSIEVGKPPTLVYLGFLDEDAEQVTFVHVFADPDAMDLHFEGADERSRTVSEFVDPDGWEIYGTPSRPALESLRREAMTSGVDLRVESARLGGYVRTATR